MIDSEGALQRKVLGTYWKAEDLSLCHRLTSIDRLAVAEAWCIAQGADSVAARKGYESDFIAHLALRRIAAVVENLL